MSDVFPRWFGRYALLEPLAQGGMGALYLGYQGEPGMEKLCVIKTVLRELADKEYVARFRDEAKVVVRLSHGNLVPVFDAGTVEGELYIAMDYVDGRDLRAVWNQCAKKGIAFPLDIAVFIVKDLARGLYHAHTAGDLQLVHRDVSPPNVLLAYSGEVRLTDFGLASSTLKLERTAPGVIYGKVSYMSPEQARGEPLDGRADLYAAGVILWELLTGRQLFPNTDGDALDRVRNPVITRPSQRASRVPSALDTIVMRALAPDRDDRYADGEEMRAALAGWLAREAPTLDNARVASFLRELFDDEIERDRRRREQLIEDARKALSDPKHARKSPPVAARPPSDRPGYADDIDDEDRSAGVLGQLIDGRYQVNRLIGEGGMGRVYEAEHIEIGKRVAIKVLHPAYSRFPEVVARFRREARAASRIGHPNIVDVTDSGTTATGAVYFVMEYLEGCDLADVIQRERALAVDRAIDIAVQLARSLEAAHQANVIHRDLKPENIFLVARPGRPDFVKVLDFGIARQIEMEAVNPKLTKPNVAMGTPEYMAPEQAAGKPADARSDIYAVGSILFEMLTGTSPHHGENAMEVLNKKATETPLRVDELREDVSAQLADVIARALLRNPAGRPQTMTELADDLERTRPDRRRRGGRDEDYGGPYTPAAVSSVAPVAAAPVAAAAAASSAPIAAPPSLAAAPVPVAAPAAAGPSVPASLAPTSPARRELPRPMLYAGGAALLLAVAGAGWFAAKNTRDAPDTKAARGASPDRDLAATPQGIKGAAVTPPIVRDLRPAEPPPVPPPAGKPERPDRTPVAPQPPRRAGPTPEELQKALDEAQRFLQARKLPEAGRAFRKVYDGGYKKGIAATGLGRVAFDSGDYSGAASYAEKAVSAGGGLDAHMLAGDAYIKTSRFGSAAAHYRAVLKKKPDHAEAKRRLDHAVKQGG